MREKRIEMGIGMFGERGRRGRCKALQSCSLWLLGGTAWILCTIFAGGD